MATKDKNTIESTKVFYAKFGVDSKVSRKAFRKWAVLNRYIEKPASTEKGSPELYKFNQDLSGLVNKINRYAKTDDFKEQGFPAFRIMYDDKPNRMMSVITTDDAMIALANKLPVLLDRRFKIIDREIKKLYNSVDKDELDRNKMLNLVSVKKLMLTTGSMLEIVIENIRSMASSPDELIAYEKKLENKKIRKENRLIT